MSTAIPEFTPTSSSVPALQQLMQEDSACTDGLIVAHDDPVMLRRLNNADPSSSMRILPIRQLEWDSCLGEIARWAEEQGLCRLMLVGHSAGVASLSESGFSAGQKAAGQFGGFRFLSGVRRQQQSLRASREHFADLVYRLTDGDFGYSLLEASDIRLDFCFYIASSDLFVRFDLQTNTFEHLTEQPGDDASAPARETGEL